MIFLTCILAWVVEISPSLHDFHTSLAQVYYNKSSQAFEVTLRVFTDDLETALAQENGNKKVDLTDAQQADSVIAGYLNKHFAVIDRQNKKKQMKYVGKELEVDVTWIYIEIPMGGGVEGIQIQNSILMEIFDDQVNIINFKYLSTERTYLYRAKQTIQRVDL